MSIFGSIRTINFTKKQAQLNDKYKNGHHKDMNKVDILEGDYLMNIVGNSSHVYITRFRADAFTVNSVGYSYEKTIGKYVLNPLTQRNDYITTPTGELGVNWHKPHNCIVIARADGTPIVFDLSDYKSHLRNPKVNPKHVI